MDRQVLASSDDCARVLSPSQWGLTSQVQLIGQAAGNLTKCGGGMRFTNITIPKGATITEAHLTFNAGNTDETFFAKSRISAEKADNAPTFANDAAAFDARYANHATLVTWDFIGPWYAGTDYNTPDIKATIQDVINRFFWVSGNNIVIFWEDFEDRATACRVARSYDKSPTYAPKLHIAYEGEPPPAGGACYGYVIG